MSTPEKPTLARRILRFIAGIIFAAAAVKSFMDHETVLGILFLVVSIVFAGSAAIGTIRGSQGKVER